MNLSARSPVLVLVFAFMWTAAFPADDALSRQFARPEKVNRPGTWWRWINGNVTRDGIARDLREMARLGIGSVGIFDVDGPAPVGPVGMMKQDWRALFRFTVEEAARLGIEVHVSPTAGWGIGGPWIDENDATKTLGSVEVRTKGAILFDAVLPRATGHGTYYRDVAVLAVREPQNRAPAPVAVVASSVVGGYQKEENWPPADVVDHDPDTFWKSARAPSIKQPVWIEARYASPETFTSVYIAGVPDAGPRSCTLQASADGQVFRDVAAFSLQTGEGKQFDIPSTTAAVFRLSISAAGSPDVRLAEWQLLRSGDEPVVRKGIEYWWFKSGHRAFWDWPKAGPSVLDESDKVADGTLDCRSAEVVDLTGRMSADGRLHWDVPPGNWTIIRFGSVLLGEPSRWMSRALQGGYEVDPYSVHAAQKLYDNTAGVLVRDVGPLAGKTFNGIVVDSYEIGATAVGLQGTWTEDFRAQFVKRRGYDPIRFLPAMARRIVDSREATERFLADYRATLADLYLEFYGRLRELAHRDGLKLWAQNSYGSYPFPHIDGLAASGVVDIPMGEFWYGRTIFTQFYAWADPVRTAASGAHIYGHKYVGAETLTMANGLLQTPDEWKTTLDREFANGMNLVTLNCWSLQYEVDAKPGLYTYDILNDNMTWWGQSRAFLDYLARCQLLLQQGKPVADACYFYGQGTAKFVPSREQIRPLLPAGYEFDAIDATALQQRLATTGGSLVLPDGLNYRYLVLPENPNWRATPDVLRHIQALVQDGATVFGGPPAGAPGLGGSGQADEFRRLTDSLWGNSAAASKRKGRVVTSGSLAELFHKDGVLPDLDARAMTVPEKIAWCHRRSDDVEVYFLSNQTDAKQAGTVKFRIRDQQPELWYPLTGEIRAAEGATGLQQQTEVPIELEPGGSIFVVFRRLAKFVPTTKPAAERRVVRALSAEWRVTFDARARGPASPVTFLSLDDWIKRPEPEIRHYSGTAVYETNFDAPTFKQGSGARWFLDLGVVKNIARVRLNGRDLGTLWTAPWSVEITDQLKAGGNHLEVEVTNVWTNRIIGDLALPVEQRPTKTTFQRLKPNSPLSPAGLQGPVTLQVLERQ